MNCAIVDLDGTLANCDHRLHHIDGAKKNWDLFFQECSDDTVIQPMLNLIKLLSKEEKCDERQAKSRANLFAH